MESEYNKIKHHVRMCAARAVRIISAGYLTADDLEQDYYTWLLVSGKKHNRTRTFFRMIDRIRNYTHFNRITKTRPLTTVNVPPETESHQNVLLQKEDTSASLTLEWQHEQDAQSVIDRLNLNQREKTIMRLFYIDGLTQGEISDIVGVCNSRISQLLKNGRAAAKEYYLKQEKNNEDSNTGR